jgi:hypothetical protein
MSSRFRPHLSYANVVSTICLFVLLGGTAYAVTGLSRNSVRSRHIAPGQVKRSDLGRNAVTSSRVRNGTLLRRDFRRGVLVRGGRGPRGARGPRGLRGRTGARGPAGAPGLSALQLVSNSSGGGVAVDQSATASCPAGKVAISGGTETTAGGDVVVVSSRRTADGRGWTARWQDTNGGGFTGTVTVLCARVS